MSKFLDYPVRYLEKSDFDQSGNLVNKQIPANMPILIMIQANFCGYCTQAKPAFQQFANQTEGRVFCATIQADSENANEKALASQIKTICPDFRGYPSYVIYKNGKYVKTHNGDRNIQSLIQAISI